MTADQAIDMLDRMIAVNGSTVTLRRLPSTDVDCPALVRDQGPNELVGGLTQGDSTVILSPTQINAAAWPGAQVNGKPDNRIPSKNLGDLVVINNRVRSVQNANAIYIGNVLVRIEIQVR